MTQLPIVAGRVAYALILVSCVALSPGCDDSDAASIKIKMDGSLGGTVTTSSLSVPDGPAPLEASTTGVTWDAAAVLRRASGRFDGLAQAPLKVGDITFSAEIVGSRRHLEVLVPRGPAAKWPRLLAPLEGPELTKARAVLDPKGEAQDLGRVVKIEIGLPFEPLSHGVSPSSSRIAAETIDGTTATLLVRLDSLGAEGAPPVRWWLSWVHPD